MKTKDLKIEQVYICSDGQKTAHVYYYGMSEDKFTFIPYNMNKQHFCGMPCVLKESEVKKFIKPI